MKDIDSRLDLTRLRSFVAVATELHFGRAAGRLGLSQPALSRQLQLLERALGLRLVSRTRRRVALTDAGRLFLDEAQAVLDQASRAHQRARELREGALGSLRVAFVPWTNYTRFPAVIRAFVRRHPEVHMELSSLAAPVQLEALRGGRIEVGFTRSSPEDPRLASTSFVRERLVVVLPHGHRLASHPRLSLEVLRSEPYIHLARESAPTFADLVERHARAVDVKLNVRAEADHPEMVLTLVAGGLGYSLVPASVRTILRPGLLFRLLERQTEPLETVIVWRHDNRSPVLRAFLDIVPSAPDGTPTHRDIAP